MKRTLQLSISVPVLILLVAGCASSEIKSYQKTIDDIDYKTAGEVVRKIVTPPIGGVTEGVPDYIAINYKGTAPRDELIDRLNDIGGDCTTYEDSFYVSCRGVENTVIKITQETISVNDEELVTTYMRLSRY